MFLSPALVLLFALAPAYGIICRNTSTGLVAALVAVNFASTIASLRVGPAQKLARLLTPTLGVVLLTPLAWMLVQLAPTSLGWLSDPVWRSTSAALDMPRLDFG